MQTTTPNQARPTYLPVTSATCDAASSIHTIVGKSDFLRGNWVRAQELLRPSMARVIALMRPHLTVGARDIATMERLHAFSMRASRLVSIELELAEGPLLKTLFHARAVADSARSALRSLATPVSADSMLGRDLLELDELAVAVLADARAIETQIKRLRRQLERFNDVARNLAKTIRLLEAQAVSEASRIPDTGQRLRA